MKHARSEEDLLDNRLQTSVVLNAVIFLGKSHDNRDSSERCCKAITPLIE